MTQNDAVFHPHPWQARILLHLSKRKVVLTGRQSGKTTLLKSIIYSHAISLPNQEILVLASTHGQVKELLWRAFTNLFTPLFPPEVIIHQNNQDMVLELFNGTRISFKGTENIEALLGRTLDLLILDEWQSHNENVWTYLEPMLAARQGTAIFTGSARKGNHIMDFYERGQSIPEWQSWKITTPDSGSPAGYPEAIKMAKASNSEDEFNQEYMCLPMSGEGSVYPDFGPDNIVSGTEIDSIIKLSDSILHIGMDFNIDNMATTVCVKIGNCIYVVDEIMLKHRNANTHNMVDTIKRKYPDNRKFIYPDASGRGRDVSNVDPTNTNHQIIRQAGYNLIFDHSGNPPRVDRVILLNSKIKPMEGAPTFYVHERCKSVIESLMKRQYKNSLPDKTSGYDHCMDALEYTVWQLFRRGNGVSQSSMYGKKGAPTVRNMINGSF